MPWLLVAFGLRHIIGRLLRNSGKGFGAAARWFLRASLAAKLVAAVGLMIGLSLGATRIGLSQRAEAQLGVLLFLVIIYSLLFTSRR